ncbi:PAS domain-containing sensor histidine kinase [Natrialba asiatica]|uniref:histidine kinase n=1 Tax=Natrialba asiatica (strain ATCC 700177 / DSM 12278 / JCM 9576 / FERM P-10747 / NBRC 102637 / 172P1) TaxID=29540 RepID=M0AIK9_NATA1|nr:PAS domain S-box protein [Natrialba asiatica]ELY98500.1 PAS/PAC sensor signal transduction histidine kinase [Natrialba asiatica DSM 12278]
MDRRQDRATQSLWGDVDDGDLLTRFRALVTAIDDGICQLDTEGRFVAVNDSIVELTGYTDAELRGEHVSVILNETDTETIERKIAGQAAAGTDSVTPLELDVQTATGTVIPCEFRLAGMDEDGSFHGIIGVIRNRSETTQQVNSSGSAVTSDDTTGQERSEGDIEENEEAFQSLVDAVEEYAIFRLDENGYVTTWNRGAKQIKGYDRAEIIGKHFSTFYTAEDRETNVPERNLEAAIENGSVEDEGWRIRKDGTRFWANVTITPDWDEDGTHQGYLKVTRDMTDRRKREMELKSELQRIFDRISDALYAVDEEFRFTLVNERAEELLGYPEADLLGEKLWDVFPSSAEIDEVWDAFHTARDEQVATSYELYYDHLGFWVEANLYPSETGISVYFRDVTERKRREQALEESEQRYRTIAEYFPDGIITLYDHNLDYTLAAGQGFEKVDEEPSDVEGANFYDAWSAETRDNLEPILRAALNGERRSVELWHDGREWVVYAVPVTDNEGNVFAGVTMAHDITERKENQRKLEETITQLEESNKRLEQFAYAASHDLQEPLRMVSSYLQLIEHRYGDAFDEDGEEFLEFAIDGADRMRKMIEALLTYSRIETRGEPLKPVALDDILADVRQDLRVQIEETNAEITAVDLPRVEGDADQLRQVFQNLLGNAIEYSGADRPRVHIDADRRASDRRQKWVISVRDEGIGIEADEQDRVFEVFERLHTREDHPGTGIGLALCRRIIERHGGEIWVDSKPGAGSTFSFTLPAVEGS